MEDPALIVSMSASEEEPGEGEKQDCIEGTQPVPQTLHLRLITQADKKTSTPPIPANCLEIVSEVVLPPPEKSSLPQPEFSCNI